MRKRKERGEGQRVEKIKGRIENLSENLNEDLFSYERKDYFMKLESKKLYILNQKEETWKQKSRFSWLQGVLQGVLGSGIVLYNDAIYVNFLPYLP